MKLGDIYSICKEKYGVIEAIKLPIHDVPDNIDLLNVDLFFCEELRKIECIKSAYESFVDYPANVIALETGLDSDEHEEFEYAKSCLLAVMDCIIKMYEETGRQSKKEIGLDIRFPVSGNFSDFRKDIDELDFILTKCPFFQDEKESLRFDNVDIGSFWLTFAVVSGSIVGGSILLNNIAAFVDKCIVIRSHYLTVQQQKANMEKAQVDQKEKEEIIKALNRYYKIAVNKAISELEEITNCKLQDGDERGRVEQAIEKMGKLIDKGMQIYATIDSPEETKALFEPLEMHYLEVDKQLKLLEDKKEEEK